ncbi:MarR family winged helix-turn-helix transcriptional regulator [Sphingomonas bacterium]|uniref:MarR family winged helix-turn-helix transcriptional regulator n=1 Tax=Sphingomonas bacterium TaxID=1895847 RepID=UPI001576B158|nr:MarR family winged helix-turn-helix transcriptional regulator [Sphingomonas bacterium]
MSRGSASHGPLVAMIDEIVRLGPRLRNLFNDTGATTGLTPLESTVLTAVAESRSSPTVPQIGRSLGHHRQVVQRAAITLTGLGLIEVRPNPDHKRANLLAITPAGKAVYRKIVSAAQVRLDDLVSAMDPVECERIAGELGAFRHKIEAHLRSAR